MSFSKSSKIQTKGPFWGNIEIFISPEPVSRIRPNFAAVLQSKGRTCVQNFRAIG